MYALSFQRTGPSICPQKNLAQKEQTGHDLIFQINFFQLNQMDLSPPLKVIDKQYMTRENFTP